MPAPEYEVLYLFYAAGALQLGAGGGVKEVLGVRVLLQVRSGNICRDGAIDGLVYDGGLLLAPSHQAYLLGIHDGGYTHGDGVAGYVLETTECGGGVGLGQVVQMYLAGAGGVIRAGRVEADVAGAADAENLEIQTTASLNLILVCLAVGGNLFLCYRAAGQVDVFGGDVDVVEEVGVHEVPVGLYVLTGQTIVFIKVEGGYILEGKTLFLVKTNELGIETKGRSTCGQAQYYALALSCAAADEFCYLCCQCLDSFLLCCENFVSHGAIILYHPPVKSTLKYKQKSKI